MGTTRAATYGTYAAVIVGSVLALITVLTAPLLYLTETVNAAYLCPITVAAGAVLFAAGSLLRKPDIQHTRGQLRTFFYVKVGLYSRPDSKYFSMT